MGKKLIFIVGKTSSGKDTVAKYMSEKYGIPMVVSYTTRPKRCYEIEGVHHYFVSSSDMERILNEESILAYTEISKSSEGQIYQYCATADNILGDVAIYIIDPNGIDWFNRNYSGEKIDCVSIYVDLDESTMVERALKRGDSEEVLRKRLEAERYQFDSYRDNKQYDYIIVNSGSLKDLENNVDWLMGSWLYNYKVS